MSQTLISRVREKFLKITGFVATSDYDFMKNFLPTDDAKILLKDADSDLEQIFYKHQGQIIHKWTHYLKIYERYFTTYRNSDVKMLEIGVSRGGSLDMWREYFGGRATIYGIDINPECKNYEIAPNHVRIGSQDDPRFLQKVINEMGSPDIILDDGSHVAKHQRESFKHLWTKLKYGGLYIIEDTHTSYWPGQFNGGYKRDGTAIEFCKGLIDDMHGWYHNITPNSCPANEIGFVHFYDSMIIIEKRKISEPKHIKVGTNYTQN